MNNTDVKSIMIVGVGGQGTLLASRLLGNVVLNKGYDVKISEVHGMSQRGGSVVTYVKYGKKVYSPISDTGTADIIIAFEKLEAARWLPYLKKDGMIVMNSQKIDPMPVITGAEKYPENIKESLEAKGVSVYELDALSLAEKAGSSKAVNVVLIGLTAKLLGLDKQSFITSIENTVKEKFIDVNKKAFEYGYAI